MANFIWIALPGRWMARLAALRSGLARYGGLAAWSRPSRDQEQDIHPTTMQTIERASAFYQEKLGFRTLFFAGDFRRMY